MPDIGTRELILQVDVADDGTYVDFSAQVSTVELTAGDADSDFLSFAQARAGGAREYKLHIVMKQNTDTSALWYLIWNQAGDTLPARVRPNGGTAAGASTPVFDGDVVISEPDGVLLGGDADTSTSARMTTEVEWTFVGKPTMDITP